LSPHGPESACGDRPGHAEDEVEVMMDAAIKVLLVEDNPVDARIAAELLGKNGAFELTHVARLSEAAQQLSEQRFDAVLLDLMLPDSSGLATVDSVQERAPDVPIVVYSGFGAEDVLFAREAIRGGAQEFLPKSLASPVVMQGDPRLDRAQAAGAAPGPLRAP
jgi:CheY-like chemotaxis protein